MNSVRCPGSLFEYFGFTETDASFSVTLTL